MKRHLLILVPALMLIGLVVAVGFAKGHDQDDLRARARQMQDLAELLESQGNEQVAEHLAEQAERLIHKADEMDERREREEVEEPERVERRERIRHRARLVRQAIGHMHEAAKQLHEADVHELADHLHHKAEQLEGELHTRSKRIHHKELHDVVGKLRKEVARLRRDMDRLAHHVRELSHER